MIAIETYWSVQSTLPDPAEDPCFSIIDGNGNVVASNVASGVVHHIVVIHNEWVAIHGQYSDF